MRIARGGVSVLYGVTFDDRRKETRRRQEEGDRKQEEVSLQDCLMIKD